MYQIYIIEKGDTIDSIAKKFNTTVSELYKLNSFSPNFVVSEGKRIIVPLTKEPLFDYYTIEKGDTLSSIAKKYNIDVKSLAALNGLDLDDYIYPNQTILIPKKDVSFYITTEGDTMNTVSKKLNNTPVDLLLQNETLYLVPNQLIIYKK